MTIEITQRSTHGNGSMAFLCLLTTQAVIPSSYGGPLPEKAIGYDFVFAAPDEGRYGLRAYAMDDMGRIIGPSYGDYRAPAIWVNGRTHEFNAGPLYSDRGVPYGISPQTGLVVGYVDDSGDDDALVWTLGRRYFLSLPPGSRDAYASDANDSGWVVGNSSFPRDAILWRPGHDPLVIGSLPWQQETVGFAINALGAIVGRYYRSDYGDRAFYWREDLGMFDISDPGSLRNASWASGINDLGEVVGQSTDIDGQQGAFLWRDGEFMYYPMQDQCTFSVQWATAINNLGHAVGTMYFCGNGGAVVWWETETPGVFDVADLNDRAVVPSLPADFYLHSGRDVNNGGQILAGAEMESPPYHYGGALLTPYHFELSDLTPGRAGELNSLTVRHLQPGAQAYFIWGRNPGARTFDSILGSGGGGGNPPIDCPGAPILIQQPRGLFGPFTADLNGEVRLEFHIPAPASGQTVRMQVAVPDECRVSHVVEVTIE